MEKFYMSNNNLVVAKRANVSKGNGSLLKFIRKNCKHFKFTVLFKLNFNDKEIKNGHKLFLLYK